LIVETHSPASVSKDLKKLWTPEEDQRLLKLKAAGKANAVIGHALRRSTTSIVTRLLTLKIDNLKRADGSREKRYDVTDRDKIMLCIVGAFGAAVVLIDAIYMWARNGVY
jgi:hypothetical protein